MAYTFVTASFSSVPNTTCPSTLHSMGPSPSYFSDSRPSTTACSIFSSNLIPEVARLEGLVIKQMTITAVMAAVTAKIAFVGLLKCSTFEMRLLTPISPKVSGQMDSTDCLTEQFSKALAYSFLSSTDISLTTLSSQASSTSRQYMINPIHTSGLNQWSIKIR